MTRVIFNNKFLTFYFKNTINKKIGYANNFIFNRTDTIIGLKISPINFGIYFHVW